MNIKKILTVALAGAISISMLAGCGAEKTQEVKEDNSLTKVQEQGYFTLGLDADFAPMGFTEDDGTIVGFDIDLANAVAEKMGVKVEVKPIDWDSKSMELSTGKIDVIWNGFSITDERRQEVLFSNPYLSTKQSVIVKAGSDIKTKADLAGKNVGVQKDSSALAALEDEANADLAASFASLTQYADYNTGFMDLEAGAIDALALDIGVAKFQVSSREDGAYVILDDALALEQYAVGFLKGNDALKDQVEATLMEMVEDGTFTKIAENYADYGLVDSVCLGK